MFEYWLKPSATNYPETHYGSKFNFSQRNFLCVPKVQFPSCNDKLGRSVDRVDNTNTISIVFNYENTYHILYISNIFAIKPQCKTETIYQIFTIKNRIATTLLQIVKTI